MRKSERSVSHTLSTYRLFNHNRRELTTKYNSMYPLPAKYTPVTYRTVERLDPRLSRGARVHIHSNEESVSS